MKKKFLIVGLSTLVLGVTAALTVGIGKKGFSAKQTKGDDDYWTISFDALDLVGELGTPYKSGDTVLKTDQNKNDVSFHYDNCYAREFNGTNYLEVNDGGYVANTTEIRGMVSLTVLQMGEFDVEWGFVKEAGVVQYVASTSVYRSNIQTTYEFEGTAPNYFRFTNHDGTSRQLTNFVIKMDKKCESSVSPYAVKSGLSFMKHESYAECIGFFGSPQSSVVIPNEVESLPVTKIADRAFYREAGITSLVLPNTLKIVGTSAFQDCEYLEALEIPKSVEEIHQSGFGGLSRCTNLTFEAGGTTTLSLSVAAFEGLGHEGTLTLPSRVDGISTDGYVFSSSPNITAFALNSDNHANNILSVEDGVLFADRGNYNYFKKTLISYPAANPRTEYEIPSDCTRIETRDGLSFSFNIQKLIINNDVDMMFGAASCQSMASLKEIEFKKTTHAVHFYWYAFDYCPALKKLVVPTNLIVDDSGLGRVSSSVDQPLNMYFPGNEIPNSWHRDWDGGDLVRDGKIKTLFYSEDEPATTEDKLTHWHDVSGTPTPWALSIEFRCYRSDIGEGWAFYVLGTFNSWTASEACRGTYDNGCWTVSMVLSPNTTYQFKGVIAEWDNPTNLTYEVDPNRSWTPDSLSHVYDLNWQY